MTTIHKIKWFTLSVIAVLFFILVAQNTGVTGVRFMGWEVKVPRMLLICGAGLGGFAAGILAVLLIQRHRPGIPPASVGSSQPDSREEG